MKSALLEVKQLTKRSPKSEAIDFENLIHQEEGRVKVYFSTKTGRLMYQALSSDYIGNLGYMFFVGKLQPLHCHEVEMGYLSHVRNSSKRFNWIVLAIATANIVRGLNVYALNPFSQQDVKKATDELFTISEYLFTAIAKGTPKNAN